MLEPEEYIINIRTKNLVEKIKELGLFEIKSNKIYFQTGLNSNPFIYNKNINYVKKYGYGNYFHYNIGIGYVYEYILRLRSQKDVLLVIKPITLFQGAKIYWVLDNHRAELNEILLSDKISRSEKIAFLCSMHLLENRILKIHP